MYITTALGRDSFYVGMSSSITGEQFSAYLHVDIAMYIHTYNNVHTYSLYSVFAFVPSSITGQVIIYEQFIVDLWIHVHIYTVLYSVFVFVPVHAATDCGPPPSAGSLLVSHSSTLVGSKAIYTCSHCHVMVGVVNGSVEVVCGSDGSWEGPKPMCTREYI